MAIQHWGVCVCLKRYLQSSISASCISHNKLSTSWMGKVLSNLWFSFRISQHVLLMHSLLLHYCLCSLAPTPIPHQSWSWGSSTSFSVAGRRCGVRSSSTQHLSHPRKLSCFKLTTLCLDVFSGCFLSLLFSSSRQSCRFFICSDFCLWICHELSTGFFRTSGNWATRWCLWQDLECFV